MMEFVNIYHVQVQSHVIVCVRSLFRFVLIKLRHCGHLALAAKLVLCLVVLKACVPKLCVLLYSVVLSCVAACLMCHYSKLRLST